MALRILFVEDNVLAAEATTAVLVAGGHTVEWVAAPELALARHGPGRWDFVLTDVRLARMTGWELIARLQEREPGLPAGVLTGWPPEPNDPPPAQRGARFMLVKPVDPAELLLALETVIPAMQPQTQR